MWLQHTLFVRSTLLVGLLIIYFLFIRGRTIGFTDELVHQYGAKKAWFIVIAAFLIFLGIGYLFGYSGSPLNRLTGPAPGSIRP